MAKGISIAERVEALVTPCITDLGYRIWDVEYVKEGAEWYLRITLDSDDGIDIDDCEKVSRAINPIIDEADPIEDFYYHWSTYINGKKGKNKMEKEEIVISGAFPDCDTDI